MSENTEERKRESEKVTLAGLTARLSVRTGDTKRQTEDFLRELFAAIADELEKGESVKVPGLGIFKSIEVEARKSVNVNSGEETLIPGHRKIVYIASKELSATVNEPFSMFQTIELTDEDVSELEEPAPAESVLPVPVPAESELTEPANVESVQSEPERTEPALPDNVNNADSADRREECEHSDVSDNSEQVEINDVPFSNTVYELKEPEIIPESELERQSLQEEESELIPESSEPESNEPESNEPESNEPGGTPEGLETGEDFEPDVTVEDSDLSEISEPRHHKRFWPGFIIGFAAACLITFIAGWVLLEYDVISTEQAKTAESKPVAVAITPNKQIVSAESDATDTLAVAEMSEKSGKPESGQISESASGQVSEPAVPTQPSDKKVYDTITKTRYLTTMAKDHYGNYHLWPYIYKENEKILGHPDRIRPGTKVVVPPLSKYGVNPNNKADIDKAKKLGAEIYARYN